MFQKLCGKHAYKSIILVTTKWVYVPPEIGVQREGGLEGKYWKEMIDSGCRVERFEGTSASAWKIINIILDFVPITDGLRIQQELVDLSRYVPKTEAGKALRDNLQQQLDMQKKMIETLEAEVVASAGNSNLHDRKLERLEATRNQMKKTLDQLDEHDIKLSIRRRIIDRLFS